MITTPGIDILFKTFEAKLKEFKRYSQKSSRDILLKFQNQFAANLAFTTQPYGLKPVSEDKGKLAVARDIKEIYHTPAQVWNVIKKTNGEDVAKAIYSAIKRNDVEAANKILDSVNIPADFSNKFDAGTLHRNAKVALPKSLRGKKSMITSDKKAMDDYIREVQKRVGFAKAGWVVGLPSRRGVPDWVAKHRSLGFIVDKTKFTFSPQLIFQNNVPWIRSIFKMGSYKQSFKRMRIQILNELIRMIKADAKKAKVTK